jgi:desulfoferrodoxin (superoxide reductase-like protein)
MKLRKSLLIILLAVSTLVLITSTIQAHSPSTMNLQYDFASKTLDVTVTHDVADPNTHYIEEIKIWVNDILNQTRPYTSQDSNSQHQDTFTVPAVDGDVIKVQAICNIAGSVTDEITVLDPSIPEYGIIAPIAFFLIVGSLLGWIMHKRHTKKR